MAMSGSTVPIQKAPQCRVVCTDFSLLLAILLFVCDGVCPVDLSVNNFPLAVSVEYRAFLI